MKPTANVLLIEDDASTSASLQRVLEAEGYSVSASLRGDEGLQRAQSEAFDLVIADLKLPGLNGLDLVERLHRARPRLPIILMTAHGTTETAIEAIKLGAFDYLLKPFDIMEFLELVAKGLKSIRLMSEPIELGKPAANRSAIIGTSRAMQNLYKEIGRVASAPVTVMIRGETGSGKDLVARAIYQHSGRAEQPFIAVNCAAIPETLLESELFGHERGAFTGADNRRIGRFEQAHRGTLFLDEIGDMSPVTQAKLLRVLQEQRIRRLGGRESIPVDVRVLAATHCDLEAAIREKSFREDLYYRLSVVTIFLPSLRQRPEDIPDLVRYFMQRHGAEMGATAPAILPEALEFLRTRPWLGNVRELENVARQALLTSRDRPITVEILREVLAKSVRTDALVCASPAQSLGAVITPMLESARAGEMTGVHGRLMREVERELFTRAIKMAGGNQARAARWLGVSRVTMREKLHQFGLMPGRESVGEVDGSSQSEI